MNTSRKLRIYVLIDALGWRILEGREFLSDVLTYRRPLKTVLGFSSGAIPTMLTGLPPVKTGHWNLFYYDPTGSPFRWLRPVVRLIPEKLLDTRIGRKIAKEMGRRFLGLGPLFECCVSPRLLPYFNWVEKRCIYEEGGITGAPSIFDQAAGRNVDYRSYSYHHWTDEQILAKARLDISSGEASLYFLYLSELDALLHKHPSGGPELEARLAYYQRELRTVFEMALKRDPQASFTVLSDHGMTPVTERFDLVAEVEKLGFRMPDDYLAVYDSTMARFWFFNPEARRSIGEKMRSLSCARVLSDGELDGLGLLFPDRRYGQEIVLLNPGWLVARSDFNGKGWNPNGMHGYHPDDSYSDAIFLSNERPTEPVETIADVHRCMQEALS